MARIPLDEPPEEMEEAGIVGLLRDVSRGLKAIAALEKRIAALENRPAAPPQVHNHLPREAIRIVSETPVEVHPTPVTIQEARRGPVRFAMEKTGDGRYEGTIEPIAPAE